ncbi:MAG TPA: OmpA family protein [Nitrospiria bacterium]|nr:OmpA family protein [Nitrospiria bacterium]
MNTRQLHVLFAVTLAAGLSAGCVSSSKYRALEAKSTADQSELQGQIFDLKSQKQALERDKAGLERDLAALRQEKDRADAEVRSLNERLPQLEQQAAAVSAQKDEEIRRLKGTYDDLVKDLKGEIEKGEIKVTQIRDKLSVNLVEKVLFDSGRAEVKTQGEAVLKKVGAILGEVKDKEIRIEGYTDNVPIGENLRKRFPTNWELSTQRATNVLRFLEEQAGVDGARLSAIGYGPFRPLADNQTPEGRAQNRRIEIVLVPQDVKEVLKELQ